MLTITDTNVSAIYRIVFTCFLISFFNISFAQQSYSPARDDLEQTNSIKNSSLSTSKHARLRWEVEAFLHEQIQLSETSNQDPNTNIEQQDNIHVDVRKIDKRISIPNCSPGFDFSLGSELTQQSNQSIKVTCANSNWYLFVHATVSIMQQVVVSRENLSPGSLLNRRNLEVINIDKNRLRGSVFTKIEQVAGARIKRRMRAGNIINDRMLCFICKGDRVTIAATSGGLSVKVYGVAVEDGVLGDTIQVRNISSDKLVFGRIASTSEVQVSI